MRSRFSPISTVLLCLLVLAPLVRQPIVANAGTLPDPIVLQAAARELRPPQAGQPAPFLRPMAQAATAITTRANDQIHTAIAYSLEAGEYMVVWEDEYTSTDHDIYARRVGSDGTPVGSEFGIATSGIFQSNPAVAYNPAAEEYLVVWQHEYSADDHDIYARRVGSNGTPVGSEFGIATRTNFESNPDVIYNPSVNEYLIIWEHHEGSGEFPHNDIYGQRLDASGAPLGSTIVIANGPLDDESVPAVGHGGVYLVVWQNQHPEKGEYDIYGQRLGNDGSLMGSKINISTWQYDQLKPRLAFNITVNEFLVVWEDHHWGWGNDWDIYGQRVNADGTLDGGNFGISWEGGNHRENPDVAYNQASDEYMVVWEYEYASDDHDVYRRRLMGDGTLLGDETKVSGQSSHEGQPVLAADDDWSYLVVWEDGRDAGTQGLDLYAARLHPSILSGYVYAGNVGDETTPLRNVTVELYCSDNPGDLGGLIASTVTDSEGWYGLPVYDTCEFYNILETDLPDYSSVGSTSIGGTIVSSNWIQYALPLGGKTLTGNKFWDAPPSPTDTIPPGNWANFTPSDWVANQTVTAAVQVEDTVSGLAVSTAEYAYSTDGGSSWSDWQTASCTGSDGTTDPQIITAANVPFGQGPGPTNSNRIKFRIADLAHNVGESSAYSVYIDTVPPQNPTTLFSGTHTPSTWSDLNLVTCQWSGASDDGSGLAGYSYTWDHAPSTVPGATVDTTMIVVTSYPLADANDWYFHVRAVDQAGNGAVGAAHYGPFYIDTAPPSSWVLPLDTWQGDIFIDLSWVGDAGAGAPIASYDIKVVDQYNGNVTVIDLLTDTTITASTFTGERGHTYYFSSRARDLAGHLESYPTIADAVTTVGRDVTVRVRDEGGANKMGAKVYHNGKYVGLTNGSGTITVNDALIGDELAALYQVYEHPTVKNYHDLDGSGNWAWRVYQTNVNIANDGTPQLFAVADINSTQQLTVRKNQPLVGAHMVVSVEWDADSSYMSDMRQGLENASTYLYDVGDGHFFWEVIEVFDNRVRWFGCDMQFHASNHVRPSAHRWGVAEGDPAHINMGRYWNGSSGSTGNWSLNNGFRTMIHEFGHYELGLWDEYLDRKGKQTNAFCATNRNSTPEDERASIMDNQNNATELCSRVDPNHQHRTQTQHDAESGGESTWETVLRLYEDSAVPARWTLQSPDDRGGIVAGPRVIPVDDWVEVYVDDIDTGACSPFTTKVVYVGSGAPVDGAEVRVDRPWPWPDLYQGKTNASGQIVILGAHNGDTLRVRKDSASYSGSVNCTATSTTAAEQTLVVEPDPFTLAVSVVPLSTNTVQVQAASSVGLSANPIAEVWQEGAEEPLIVTLTHDTGLDLYTGQAMLNSALGLYGHVQVEATDDDNQTVQMWQTFNIEPVSADEFNSRLYSADGNFELVLPAGSLSADAVIAIQHTTVGSAVQGDLVRVSTPYQVLISTNEYNLNADATIHMHYHADQVTDVQTDTLQIHHWDEVTGQWVSDGGSVNTVFNLVSTDVNHLSSFAILGQRAAGSPEGGKLYLPVISKNYH